MEKQNLNSKLLETSIATMSRNRTLLFSINLIAALILTIVYLENFSFDKKQREGHLMAYQDHCKSIGYELFGAAYIDKLLDIKSWNSLSNNEKTSFLSCSDLDAIRSFITVNTTVPKVKGKIIDNIEQPLTEEEKAEQEKINKEKIYEFTKIISEKLFRLNRIQNEMENVRLESATAAPLGLGLSVPRNDLVLICGALLIMLCMWLFFSFKQHTRIITKIKLLFPEEDAKQNNEVQATINDLIELNFLFQTNKREKARHFVRILYWTAPISMCIATINDFISDAPESLHEFLSSFLNMSTFFEVLFTIILVKLGLSIHRLDQITNKEPKYLVSVRKLNLGMSLKKVSKILQISSMCADFSITALGKSKLKFLQDVKSLSLNFLDEKLAIIDIVYSNDIEWKNSMEFARILSKRFSIPFDLWEFEPNSNIGVVRYKDFSIDINSDTNQVVIIDIFALERTNENEQRKQNFNP